MPANLTPQYYEAERKYRQAVTPQDKLESLKLMLAEIPKHKGTEKLQGDIKRKIAKTKSELQKSTKHGPKAHSFHVPKEGGGQVVMVGPPNVGKSSLLRSLTHAKPDVTDYPFATRKPCPGMMNFENIQIQLVDLPPVSTDFMEYWVPNIIRNADLVALIVDLGSSDPLDQIEKTRNLLLEKKTELVKIVSDDVENISIVQKKTLLFGNKFDLEAASDSFNLLREIYEEQFEIYPVSANNAEQLNQFKQAVFSALEIIRVYSKPPGKPVDHNEPFILNKKSTLSELVTAVHRELAPKLRFARVWGKGKFDGQRINRDYELMDEDIIELHL